MKSTEVKRLERKLFFTTLRRKFFHFGKLTKEDLKLKKYLIFSPKL